MFEHYYAVIMAGGEGSRLWPLSRQSRPKQMVQLGSDRTLFQVAVDRIAAVFPPERILVVTIADQAQDLKRQSPEIPAGNFLLEPMPRGTASVVGLAAIAVRQRDPQAVMAILAADHLIQNVAYFQHLLVDALRLAGDGFLVTLGIRPTYPATGYGYIQRGARLEDYPFLVYQVQRFKEKPDEETARNFLARGDHDWNSGMFIWRIERILEEIGRFMPELAGKLEAIARDWGTPAGAAALEQVWPTITPQTVDYGIMEKADRVVVIPAVDLGWNDVGSWESMFEVFETGADGNVILDAEHMGLATTNSLVVSDHTDRLIVTMGMDNVIVVDTQDAVLICSRKHAQKVREIVNLLKKNEAARRYL
jgi:mannose-1-phosphate guanylyltransferase